MNEVLKTIKARRSTRKFKKEQIKDSEIEAIVEAGLYAPSAHNDQPWNLTVIQNKELIQDLNSAAKESVRNHHIFGKMADKIELNIFYHAPTIIVVSGKDSAMMPTIDCAAASQNMLIAAESLNIGSCWNGIVGYLFRGERVEEYKRKLGIPEGYTPYYALVFGYKESMNNSVIARKENTVHYIK